MLKLILENVLNLLKLINKCISTPARDPSKSLHEPSGITKILIIVNGIRHIGTTGFVNT